jgi:hypothetical protein
MSQKELAGIRTDIESGTINIAELNNLSYKTLKHATQGLAAQLLFASESFKQMRVELNNLSVSREMLGIRLNGFGEQIAKILIKYLLAAGKEIFKKYPHLAFICAQKGITEANLFNASDAGLDILTILARESLDRTPDAQSFVTQFAHFVRFSANRLAQQAAEILGADFLSNNLFIRSDLLEQRLKSIAAESLHDLSLFAHAAIAALEFDATRNDYNEQARSEAAQMLTELKLFSETDWAILKEVFIEMACFNGDHYFQSGKNTLSVSQQEVLLKLSSKNFLITLPEPKSIIANYNVELSDLLFNKFNSEVKVVNSKYLVQNEAGLWSVDVNLLKSTGRTRGGDTPAQAEQRELDAGKLEIHGCVGLHMRAHASELDVARRQMSLIDIAAHSLAVAIANHWDQIREVGYL